MPLYSRLSKIVVDVPPGDYDRELAFWSAAAGQPLARFSRPPGYHGAGLHGQEFWLLIQRLDQGSARVRIDIHTDDLPAEVARLENLGAGRVRQAHSWQVMRAPAGMLFCVIPEPAGTLNDSSATLGLAPRSQPAAQQPIRFCRRWCASADPCLARLLGHDERQPRYGQEAACRSSMSTAGSGPCCSRPASAAVRPSARQ